MTVAEPPFCLCMRVFASSGLGCLFVCFYFAHLEPDPLYVFSTASLGSLLAALLLTVCCPCYTPPCFSNTPDPTLQARPDNNSVVAFKDNSSAIRGFKVRPLLPLNPGGPSALAPQARDWDLLLTAETHNFPCAVAPYPGKIRLQCGFASAQGFVQSMYGQ
jgi:hypothetical protein